MPPEERPPFPNDHLVPSNPASIQHSVPELLGQTFCTKPFLSLASTRFSVTGTGDLGVDITRPTAAKGSAKGTRVRRKRRGRKGRGLAWDSNDLQDSHLAFRPPLAHPDFHFNTVFETHHLQKCFLCSSF